MSAVARVTVVTVAHESAGALTGFLASLPAGLGLVLVDNASTDGSAALARAAGARVIRSEANRGFGAGCNLGLDAVGTEFALLANPDARLTEAALDRLLAAADAFPGAAIVAPSILEPGGQKSRSWNAGHARRMRMPRRRDAEPWPEAPISAEFLSGACLLLRSVAGLRFDEGFFLYYEDDDICTTARRAGYDLILEPAAEVLHEGGRSSAPSPALDALKARHMAWSRLRFLAKREGEAYARREGMRQVRRLVGKLFGHGLTMQRVKMRRDIAALRGIAGWLRGQGHGGPSAGSR